MDSSHSLLTASCSTFEQSTLFKAKLDEPLRTSIPQQTNLPWEYKKIYAESPIPRDVTQILLQKDGKTALTTTNTLNVFTDRDRIRLNFPNTGFVDPQSIRLCFTLRPVISANNNNSVEMFSYDINTVFSRLTLYYDNSIIEDEVRYDLLSTLHSSLLDPPELSLSGRGALEGKMPRFSTVGDAAIMFNSTSANIAPEVQNVHQRNGYHTMGGSLISASDQDLSASLPRRYMVIPYCGFFHQKRLIPLPSMGQLALELTVNDANTVFVTNNTAPATLEIAYVCLMYKEYKQNAVAYLQKELALGRPYDIMYPVWDYNTMAITPNVPKSILQRQRFKIPLSRKIPKYVLACIRCDADQKNIAYNSYSLYSSWFINNSGTTGHLYKGAMIRTTALRQYRFFYNNQPLSPPVVCMGSVIEYGASSDSTVGTQIGQPRITPSGAVQEPCTPPVDPTFYLDDIFGNCLSSQKLVGQRSMFDWFHGFVDYYHLNMGTGAGTTLRGSNYPGIGLRMDSSQAAYNDRTPAPLIMALPLSSVLPDGTAVTLPIGVNNEFLELELEWNVPSNATDAFATTTPYPLILETFVCYERHAILSSEGLLDLES